MYYTDILHSDSSLNLRRLEYKNSSFEKKCTFFIMTNVCYLDWENEEAKRLQSMYNI